MWSFDNVMAWSNEDQAITLPAAVSYMLKSARAGPPKGGGATGPFVAML